MKALITDIKRFAVHDGDGIRTTVFFKGCPLKCLWCHNPETLVMQKQLAFYEHKCTLCTACSGICQNHSIADAKHNINRAECTFCGKCVDVCPNDALKIYGTEMSQDELLDTILLDKSFYDTSGGGVTLSGGECLLQADFCAELLKKCKENGLNTAIDTCGCVGQAAIDAVAPYTDTFLYDLKAFDEDVHKKCTGVSNKLILKNLEYIDSLNKKIEIRIPYIPGFNDNQTEKISRFVKELKNVVRVRVLPYHNYAKSKYNALNMPNTLPDTTLPSDDLCAELEKKYF